MNQEQNNFNSNNFNTQGNNGIPNNQPLNNQSFNQGMGFNQQPINPQQQQTFTYQQPINQMNMQQSTPQPVNTFESETANNQGFNIKPPKKKSFGLIIGLITAGIIGFGGIFMINAIKNDDNKIDNEQNGNLNIGEGDKNNSQNGDNSTKGKYASDVLEKLNDNDIDDIETLNGQVVDIGYSYNVSTFVSTSNNVYKDSTR